MGNRKKNGKRSATSSGEQSSRAWNLAEEVAKKLTQAKAVCGVMMHMKDIDELIEESLWAAEGLIEDAEKAFKELRGMAPKEVQS